MLKKASLLLIVLALIIGVAQAQSEVFFMEDPPGDSHGLGDYTYPQHSSFPEDLPEMLDLTGFRVANTADATKFEFSFRQPPDLHQPWGGAGYNFHRIDLYIVSGDKGSTETFRPGAQVSFRQPWQINLRIRDWKGSYLIHWEDDPDDPHAGLWQEQSEGFNVTVEGNTIVAEISHDILDPAAPHWRYYVLVGLQDAYGPDHYREISDEAGPWTGGGGSKSEFNPNVYDILADTAGNQEKQLKWDVGKTAVLQSVGPTTGNAKLFRTVIIAAIILIAVGFGVFMLILKR